MSRAASVLLLRQHPHLGSHHRKTTPLFAGMRRFDCRIQCQDIGLTGKAIDNADNVDNLLRCLLNLTHGGDHLRRHAAPCTATRAADCVS